MIVIVIMYYKSLFKTAVGNGSGWGRGDGKWTVSTKVPRTTSRLFNEIRMMNYANMSIDCTMMVQ